MGKYEATKGCPLWTLWADLFLYWREYGNCRTKEDWQEFHDKAVAIEKKYKNTEEYDLCLAILLTLGDVAEKREKDARQRSSANAENDIQF